MVKRTNLVQASLGGLLGGLLLAKFGWHTNLQFIILGWLLLPFMLKAKVWALLPFLIIGLNLGLWRGASTYSQLQNYKNFQDQKVTLVGEVENDAAYADRGQLEFQIGSIYEKATGELLPGTVRVRAIGISSIERGDVISASGRLREGFGARQGFMSYAEVEVLARNNSTLEKIRNNFFAGVYSTIPEPSASLGLGFLLGTRSLLPESLLLALSITGLTHIVAVSGYNLTILVRLTRRIFTRRSAYLSLACSLALIFGFVLATGFSPSIARATVVSGLALFCWYYGRTIKPSVLLLFAAALTAIINPLYLWYDLGWYLSFAAFTGVLILAPLIQKRFFKHKPKLLGQLVLETTCAQIMTLPIIALIFNEVSVISMLANVIILPLVPLAMLTTFIAGMAGMLVPNVAGWLAWPARLILEFMVDCIELMARVSWALTHIEFSPAQLTGVYAAIFVIILILRTKLKKPLDGVEVIE